MERSELLKRLEQVEQQVWHCTEQIARQRTVLADLEAEGVDRDAAQILLVRQENWLVLHLQEREKLRAELAGLNGCS
jgi:hypothetical protein